MDQCHLGGLETPSINFLTADCSATGKHAKISNENTNTTSDISVLNSLFMLSDAAGTTNASANIIGHKQSNEGEPGTSVTIVPPGAALDVIPGILQGTASLPSAISIIDQTAGPSPLTNPSSTSSDTCRRPTTFSARNVACDCNEEGQPLSVPQTTDMPSVLSTSNYDVANEKDFEDEIFNEEPIELVLQEQADATTYLSRTVSAEAPTLTERK
jgi:hypothetical protein